MAGAERHAAYVPHSGAEGFNKYLLTLLAQRRELHTQQLNQALHGDTSAANAAAAAQLLVYGNVSNSAIDAERQALQQELTLGLQVVQPALTSEALKDAVQAAGNPLAGLTDAQALLWHFRGRVAALQCERRSLQQHTVHVRRAHMQHVTQQSLPSYLSRPTSARRQLDHAGPLLDGHCECQQELELAQQCMQANLLAEADAAARIARLQGGGPGKGGVEDGDWWALLNHVVAAAPGERLGQRLLDRVRLLPLSHHHRFPIYEQVAGRAEQLDREMHAAGLRVPPKFARTPAEAEALLEELLAHFKDEEVAVLASAGELPAFRQLDLPANPAGRPGSAAAGAAKDGGGSPQHRVVYVARKILVQVLERQQVRTPGASTVIDLEPAPSLGPAQGSNPSAAAAAAATGPRASRPNSSNGAAAVAAAGALGTSAPVTVVQHGMAALEALVPTLEGDLSAANVAVVRSLGSGAAAPPGSNAAGIGLGTLHVDEVLRAENAFLDVCDVREVSERLKAQAEVRAERYAYLARVAGRRSEAGAGTGGTLSVAQTSGAGDWALSDKALEAAGYLRFLRTKRNKLKVLHYMNALVSMQLDLLRDEAFEHDVVGTSPQLATVADKEFTCPVRFAAASTPSPSGNGNGPAVGDGGDSGKRPSCSRAGAGAGASGGGTAGSGSAAAAGGAVGGAAGGQVGSSQGDEAWMGGWYDDREAGVAVRDAQGRWVVHQRALDLFRELEEELLRTASYHMEQYTSQLYAAGRGSEAAELDRTAVLDDLWALEAGYCAARHRAVRAYLAAYRHAESWGVLQDLFCGLGKAQGGPYGPVHAPSPVLGVPPEAQARDRWQGAAVNSPQPLLLAARVQLRRELLDLCFRRPGVATEEGYMGCRYRTATEALDSEAQLVEQLCDAAAKEQRLALGVMHASAVAAALANPGTAAPSAQAGGASTLTGARAPAAAAAAGSEAGPSSAAGGGSAAPQPTGAWRPGLPPSFVYGTAVSRGGGGAHRTLTQEGATLPGVGAAAALVPALLRAVVSELADLHQLRHHVEVSELRRVVAGAALAELRVLLAEEQQRALAAPSKVPRDSMFKESMGSGRSDGVDAASIALGQLNWLSRSLVADNPCAFTAAALEVGCSPRAALEVALCRERVVGALYRSELAWCVYCCQSRALGRRVAEPEGPPIDWDNLGSDGEPLKPDLLKERVAPCEPADVEPPGCRPPGTSSAVPGGSSTSAPAGAGAAVGNGAGAGTGAGMFAPPPYRGGAGAASGGGGCGGLMFAVGAGGCVVGGCWRAPPLALGEFSTQLAELLQPHSPAGLRALLAPAGAVVQPSTVMAEAARAQELRAQALALALRHNQILLDYIVQKLDRRRRVLTWRAAAMEGAVGMGRPDQKPLDEAIRVGGPPGHYAPAVLPSGTASPASARSPYLHEAVEPPLLRDPPSLPQALTRRHAADPTAAAGAAAAETTSSGPSFESEDAAAGFGSRSGAAHPRALHPMLDAKSLMELKTARRRLVETCSELWLDTHSIVLRLRGEARGAFVQAVRAMHANAGAGAAPRASSTGGPPLAAPLPTPPNPNPGPAAPAAAGRSPAGSVSSGGLADLPLKLDGLRAYLDAFLGALMAPACKVDLAACARELALLVLGSTGGLGADWGVKIAPDGRRTLTKPEPSPLFTGAEGADRLLKLTLEYGPMWQPVAFDLVDKAGDPDPLAWTPSQAAIPTGFMFPDTNGNARLDTLWHVPGQWDVLASNCYAPPPPPSAGSVPPTPSAAAPGLPPAPWSASSPAAAGAAGGPTAVLAAPAAAATAALTPAATGALGDGAAVQLMQWGARLGRLLLGLVWAVLFEAAMLAPGLDLARGGDMSRALMDKARALAAAPGGGGQGLGRGEGGTDELYCLGHRPLTLAGPALYEHVRGCMQAATLPLLPGALLAPALVTLHGRMQFIFADRGGGGAGAAGVRGRPGAAGGGTAVAAAGGQAASGSRMVPVSEAAAFLERELRVHTLTHLVAVTRVRDGLASAGRSTAWRLAGALEHALARGAAVPALRPSVMQAAALRLPPPDRLALHNELARLALLLDRAVAQCVQSASTRPAAAQAVAEQLLLSAWTHDRLRDALGWRTMLMERPELYPSAPPHPLHFLRRYHGPLPLHAVAAPPPPGVRDFLEQRYNADVADAAAALAHEAAALAAAKAPAAAAPGAPPGPATAPEDEEESQLVIAPGGGAAAPGKPAWLLLSPAWGSPEVRAIEAAVVVMKQLLDLQAVQVAILKLNQDVAEMAGLVAAPALSCPTGPSTTFITQGVSSGDGGGDGTALLRPPRPPPAPGAGGDGKLPLPAMPGLAIPPGLSPLNPWQAGQRPAMARASAALIAPAIQSLVRRLLASKRRPGAAAAAVDGAAVTFEFSGEELSRWMAEALAVMSAESRGAVAALASGGAEERERLHALVTSLQEQVSGLGRDLDTFMRRQAIKVDTQVVDKAMTLLNELHRARRAAQRAGEDAVRAMEVAYLEAQKQYGAKIDELNNALMVAHTNQVAIKTDMMKGALEALLEVRREALNKAFGMTKGGMSSEMTRMMELEAQLEASQSEVLDLQRAIVKVQTWFKMRSSAFQTACMREVIRARELAQAMEQAMWEVREAAELVQEQLSSRLLATQADLEVASAALAKTEADLSHARASNKRLMAWKVSELPRAEALKLQLDELRTGRASTAEQQRRAAEQRMRLVAASAAPPPLPSYSLRGGPGGGGGGGGGDPAARTKGGAAAADGGGSGRSSPHSGRACGRGGEGGTAATAAAAGGAEGHVSSQDPGEEGGGSAQGAVALGDGSATAAVLQQAWEAQREELRGQVASLKRQLQEERHARSELFERFVVGRQGAGGLPSHAPAHGSNADAFGSGSGAGAGSEPGRRPGGGHAGAVEGGGYAPASPKQQLQQQLAALSRRNAELAAAAAAAAEERDALRRTLGALRMAAPELVQAIAGTALPDPVLSLGVAPSATSASSVHAAAKASTAVTAAAAPADSGAAGSGMNDRAAMGPAGASVPDIAAAALPALHPEAPEASAAASLATAATAAGGPAPTLHASTSPSAAHPRHHNAQEPRPKSPTIPAVHQTPLSPQRASSYRPASAAGVGGVVGSRFGSASPRRSSDKIGSATAASPLAAVAAVAAAAAAGEAGTLAAAGASLDSPSASYRASSDDVATPSGSAPGTPTDESRSSGAAAIGALLRPRSARPTSARPKAPSAALAATAASELAAGGGGASGSANGSAQ